MLKVHLFVIAVFFCTNIYAEIKEVTVTGMAVIYDNTTLESAKIQALNQARALAVEKAAGVSTKRFSLLQDQMLVADLIKSFARGFIVEETRLTWQGSWLLSPETELGYPVVKIQWQGKVQSYAKNVFRPNAINAELNKSTYVNGDHMSVELNAYEDVYILLANYTAKGDVIPLYPNEYTPNNLLLSGQSLHYPRANSKNPLIVNTYPNSLVDTEAILAIAIPKGTVSKDYSWQTIFPAGQKTSYAEYSKKIAALPFNWVAEKILVYKVYTNN